MKIAIDCRMSGKSGIGTFLDGVLPYFKQSKNELFLFGTKENPCPIKPFSIKEIFSFPKDLLKKINECDVYFTPYCNIPGGIKIPVFSTIHDVVFLDVKLDGAIGTFARKIFYKRAVFKSKEIITVSNFSKERIIHHLKCKKNITPVYNGIPEYLRTKPQDIKKKNQIIFIGNIKKHKGLATLLEAFKSFYDQCKAQLLIVGSAENFRTQDSSVFELIEALNNQTNNSIKFTGFVEDEKLKELLSESRILVQPSLYEGFGIPPLQALYMGTNAVISDIPVFKEIYKDFPVTFFKTGDSKDLSEKLTSVWKENKQVPPFPQIYSYESTAKRILDSITFTNS